MAKQKNRSIENGRYTIRTHLLGVEIRRRFPTKDLADKFLARINFAKAMGTEQQVLDELKKPKQQAGPEGPVSKMTMEQASEIYYRDWCLSRHKGPDFDKKELKNVVRIVGDRLLSSFTRDDGNYFYQTRLKEKTDGRGRRGTQVTICTANHGLTVLSAMLRWAWKEKGWIPHHPMEDFQWEKPLKKKRFPLDGIQVRRLVAEARKLDDVAGICFGIMSETGLRIGQALKLRRPFFDTRNKQIIVEPFKKNPNGYHIPLSPWAIELAKDLPILFGNDALFVNLDRQDRLHRTYLCKIFAQAREAAGISVKVTPHDLRHFRAITWLEIGWDIDKVREWMGHTAITTTKIYLDYVEHRAMERYDVMYQRELERLNGSGMEAAQ